MKQEDFYYDTCLFLSRLTKLMQKSNFNKYEKKMYLLLPIIYPRDKKYREKHYIKNKMKHKSFVKHIRDATLGDNKLDICLSGSCYIAKGSFGKIYKSQFNGKKIVIKEPITRGTIDVQGAKHNEVFDENLIQSELYCAMRGKFGSMARIPKIEFMARMYMPDSQMKIITGLEKLDGDFHEFVKHIIPKMSIDDTDKYMKDAFIQICKLLELLQDKYNFHHRDLHGENLMYKNIGSIDEPVYRWFIIDFGFAYLEKDGRKYHADKIGPYTKYTTPNFAHDLRLLFLYLTRTKIYAKFPSSLKNNSVMFRFIFFVSRQLNKEFTNLGVKILHWHNGYDYIDRALTTDKFTDPRSLREMLENNVFARFVDVLL
jgi:serine/threonine protein kinase